MALRETLTGDQRTYVEKVGFFYEAYGLRRTVGRILGLLLIADPQEQSLDEITDALSVAKSSVSTGARFLVKTGLVERAAAVERSQELLPAAAESVGEGAPRQARLEPAYQQLAEEGLASSERATSRHAGTCRRWRTSTSTSDARQRRCSTAGTSGTPRVRHDCPPALSSPMDVRHERSHLVAAVIECSGLTKYYGKNRGVAGLTFAVRPGQVFGFLGPNGAGKTTTIRCLLGDAEADARVSLAARREVTLDGRELRRRIGYVAGEVRLYEKQTGRWHLDYVAGLRGSARSARPSSSSASSSTRRGGQGALQGQQAEARARSSHHAQPRTAHTRRAHERSRSPQPADRLRDRRGARARRRDRLPQQPHPARGRARLRARRDRPRRPLVAEESVGGLLARGIRASRSPSPSRWTPGV